MGAPPLLVGLAAFFGLAFKRPKPIIARLNRS
jgi:hypothetical protein